MRGSQSFQVVWDVEVIHRHRIIAIRKAGVARDRFEIWVDNTLVLSETVGLGSLKGNKVIHIDGHPVKVSWRWGVLSGSPESIELVRNDQVLASYPEGSGVVLDDTDVNRELIAASSVSGQPQLSLEQYQQLESKTKAEKQLKGGASWFYWIAGLSMINSLIWWFGGGTSFLIGLAITQLVDGFVSAFAAQAGADGSLAFTAIALVLDFGVAGIFAVFGYFANAKHRWSFAVGMILYALDGLIFLLFGDVLSVGFHVLALFGLYTGLRALKQLKELQEPWSPLQDETWSASG